MMAQGNLVLVLASVCKGLEPDICERQEPVLSSYDATYSLLTVK